MRLTEDRFVWRNIIANLRYRQGDLKLSGPRRARPSVVVDSDSNPRQTEFCRSQGGFSRDCAIKRRENNTSKASSTCGSLGKS
ncbi:hypothetical protein PoB_004183500 [Plakobranchus ocellatus]|uniref:Uncharacterized protein n=1 Tax=Plakobranchus ocellatus TaxID=259542 RepID=A0AAV4B8D3_9GAST|nr:hypothetical protein PoB_004183500 [Plakobranchus ocellatus]